MNSLFKKLQKKKKHKEQQEAPQVNSAVGVYSGSSYVDDFMFAETIEDDPEAIITPPSLDDKPYYTESFLNSNLIPKEVVDTSIPTSEDNRDQVKEEEYSNTYIRENIVESPPDENDGEIEDNGEESFLLSDVSMLSGDEAIDQLKEKNEEVHRCTESERNTEGPLILSETGSCLTDQMEELIQESEVNIPTNQIEKDELPATNLRIDGIDCDTQAPSNQREKGGLESRDDDIENLECFDEMLRDEESDDKNNEDVPEGNDQKESQSKKVPNEVTQVKDNSTAKDVPSKKKEPPERPGGNKKKAIETVKNVRARAPNLSASTKTRTVIIRKMSSNEKSKKIAISEDKVDVCTINLVTDDEESTSVSEVDLVERQKAQLLEEQVRAMKMNKRKYERELELLDEVIRHEQMETNEMINKVMNHPSPTRHYMPKNTRGDSKNPSTQSVKVGTDIWSKPPTIPVRSAIDERGYSERLKSKLDQIEKSSKNEQSPSKETISRKVDEESMKEIIDVSDPKTLRGQLARQKLERHREIMRQVMGNHAVSDPQRGLRQSNWRKQASQSVQTPRRSSSTTKLENRTTNMDWSSSRNISRPSTPQFSIGSSQHKEKRRASTNQCWDRLYLEGKHHKERIEAWADQERRKKYEIEINHLRDGPEISDMSKRLAIEKRRESSKESRIWERLSMLPVQSQASEESEDKGILTKGTPVKIPDDSMLTYTRQTIRKELDREKYEREKFKDCTFAPQINRVSQELAAKRMEQRDSQIYEQLYKHAKERKIERETEDDTQSEVSVSSSSTYISKQQEREFVKRMISSAKNKDIHMEAIRDHLIKEENATFKPAINPSSNILRSSADRGELLYERSKEERDRKRFVEEQYENYIRDKRQSVFTNQKSDQILKEMKRKRLFSLKKYFLLEDNFRDAKIHPNTLKQMVRKLNLPEGGALENVVDVLSSLGDISLSFSQFERILDSNDSINVEAVSQEIKLLQNQFQFGMIENEVRKELRFQPRINTRSKELDKQRLERKDGQLHRYEELHAAEQHKRQRLELAKQVKEQDELDQCTFEPELLSRNRRMKEITPKGGIWNYKSQSLEGG